MASFEPVRALIRGLDILRLISEAGPIDATSISKQAKLPQPTTVRALETLMSAGYIYRLEETALYGVTARTLALSRGFDATSRLVQLARPLIEKLRAEIGWPSNLATYAQGAMTIAYTNRSAHGMSIPGRLGARIPLLATGVGLVYLAHLPSQEREDVLTALRTSDSRWDTNPKILAELDEKLNAAREDGFAFAEEAYLNDIYHSQIWAVAVPIIVEGQVVAGLSSLVLRTAGQRKRILSQILPPLQRTATMIAESLENDAGRPSATGVARRKARKANPQEV
jgi:IclR family mhp operon transcriptional activator